MSIHRALHLHGHPLLQAVRVKHVIAGRHHGPSVVLRIDFDVFQAYVALEAIRSLAFQILRVVVVVLHW